MIKYPARYRQDGDFLFAKFIDIPEAYTQGETMKELRDNAKDALSLIIEDYLDDNQRIPDPSEVSGDDIIWIEPTAKIRRRMGHKTDCECPVCQNARGERKRERERFETWIPSALKIKAKQYCKAHKISEGNLVTQALEKYFENAS